MAVTEHSADYDAPHPLRVECIRNGCERNHIVRLITEEEADARVIPPVKGDDD